MIRKKIRKQVADELSRLHIPSHDNPAVACCIKAWKLSYCDAVLKGRSTAFAKERARVSFRLAMPPLAGEDDLHDFVACVTFGMLFGVISTAEGAKFLYAVQVTNSIVREAHRHQAQRSKKSNPTPAPAPPAEQEASPIGDIQAAIDLTTRTPTPRPVPATTSRMARRKPALDHHRCEGKKDARTAPGSVGPTPRSPGSVRLPHPRRLIVPAARVGRRVPWGGRIFQISALNGCPRSRF